MKKNKRIKPMSANYSHSNSQQFSIHQTLIHFVESGVAARKKSFKNIYPRIYRVHRDWLLNCRSINLSLMSLGINGFVKKMLSIENKCKQNKKTKE